MSRRSLATLILLGVAVAALSGCMPKMTIEQMKAKMPKRPAELDRLNAFVGKWQGEGTAEFAMLDRPLKTSGTSEMRWAGDKWYLISDGTFTMEEFGEFKGQEAWTYDAHDKKYRSTWVDSMGMIGMGESTYDEKSGVWKFKARSYGAWGQSTMSGTLKFPNPDTMEWEWTEYMGLMKTTYMTGTSKRVK